MLTMKERFSIEVKQEIKVLYLKAFKKEVRMEFDYLEHFPFVEVEAFFEGDEFVGFAHVILVKRFLNVLYLAVKEQFRGKGYGSEMLSLLKRKYSDKVIMLDIENGGTLVDKKRKDFYLKNNFCENNLFYAYNDVDYEVLSYNGKVEEKDLRYLWNEVYHVDFVRKWKFISKYF